MENQTRQRGKELQFFTQIFVLLLYICSLANSASQIEDTSHKVETKLANPAEIKVQDNGTDWLSIVLNSGLVIPSNITGQCKSDVFYFFEAFLTRKHGGPMAKWTLSAIDSYGKLPSGVMEGDMSWLGRFKECVDLDIHRDDRAPTEPPAGFKGKFCLTFIVILDNKGKPIPTPVFPKCGMCFPSSCNEEDIAKMANMYTSILPIRFAVPKKYCQVKDENPWEPHNTFTMFVICLLLGLVVLGTIQDLSNEWRGEIFGKIKKPSTEKPKGFYRTLEPVLLAFSFRRNLSSLLSVSDGENKLACLTGYRFLTTVWVIVVHMFVMGVQDYPWKNILSATAVVGNNFWVQAITAATLSSDNFFFMAGMLVCYNFLKVMNKMNGQFNLSVFYLHRYFRIVPAYALTVLIIGGLLIKLGDGPLWPMLQDSTDKCSKTWWKNMLFIQNLWGSFYDQCFLPSWYIAVDFQMYLASPIFLLPLYRKPRYGLTLVWIGLIVTMIVPGILIYAYDMESYTGRQSRAENMDLWTNMVYQKPWNRMSTYFIGILVGYVLHKHDLNISMSRVVVCVGWTLCIFTSCFIVFGPYEYFKGKLMTRNMYTFYGAFARPAWASCMAWMLFACITGYGGIVNTILSWKAFQPLSRLCYCTYLIHLVIVHYIMYTENDGMYLGLFPVMIKIIGMIVLSFFCAMILSLMTEAPMLQIEKLLLRNYLPTGEGDSSKKEQPTDAVQLAKYPAPKFAASRNGSNGNSYPVNLSGSTARRRF